MVNRIYTRDNTKDVNTTKYFSQISDGINTYVIKDAEARTSIASKQDNLVSGTNIKTINNESILGSGNINIETSSTPEVDNETISYNTNNALQTIAVKNVRDNSILPIWQGTQAQWTNGDSTTWYYWQTPTQTMWTSGTMPSSANWRSIAYGNGKFVAVNTKDTNGSAVYSTDGTNWIDCTMPQSPAGWASIAYGNGKFVAISSWNVAAYSTDGINWTSSTLLSTTSWKSIVYGNGLFVAIASNSAKVTYSADGINWTETTMPSSANWQSIAYGNGKFVVVGLNTDKAVYSTDGVNWAETTMPSFNYWQAITYGNGKFVAVIGGGAGAYSTDGVNWTAITMSSSANWQSITYGDGKYVAVSNTDKAVYSTNGINWTETTMPSSTIWSSIAYGDGKFVAVSTPSSNKSAIFSISFNKCFTLDATPTTSSTVYSAPEETSALTITSVGSDSITLSDTYTYEYTPSGNQFTYRTIGDAHPDWLCNINSVGVKIGNIIVATAGGSGSSYTAGTGVDITSDVISVTSDISTGAALGVTAVQPADLATVATSGSYNDLSNKPTIPTVDQTYSSSSTSTNALSHKAIADSKFLQNKYSGSTNGLVIEGNQTSVNGPTSVGNSSNVTGHYGTAVGYLAQVSGNRSVAIGYQANCNNAEDAIQLGCGTNTESNSFYVAPSVLHNYKMLGSDGKIPDDRLSSNIARTSSVPTVDQTYSGSSTNAQSGVAVKSAIDAAISSVYKPGGSVAFASLPTPESTNEGYVYNVTDAFTTTSNFVEGAGVSYPAGTNVAVIITDQTNYYAWYLTTFSTLVYTTSATPSVGDAIYNFNFVLTDDTIKSVESDYSSILWKSDGATLTATRQSSDDTNSTTYKYDTLTGAFQPLLVSGTNIKTINNQSILGSGNIDIQSGADVEAYTASEVETIWDSVLPSSFSFIKGSGVTDYTINNQTYTSNESISLWDGEYILSISTSSMETGGLRINDTGLGLTSSCSVIVSGSSITFSDNTYTVSGTSSTNFTLSFGGGGSN